MSTFQNIYYKRTAATAKPCYMCYRPTNTVLATINTTDFLYTCDGHLTDRGFATLIEPQSAQAGQGAKVADEEIRRIKEEWEERQRKKEERKDKDAGNVKDITKDNTKDTISKQSPLPSSRSTPSSPMPPSTASKPTHQRYSLHREVFSMRQAEHRKKRQNAAVKDVAPRLPIIPRGLD